MQAGDLADEQLADLLRMLAAAAATGGLHVRRRDEHGESADAVLFLRDGQLYAATAPGPRPLLGVRLVAAGAVTREALEEALESQAGELAGWRLGELLVHLGYVDADIVAEFVVEQILDTVAEVSVWSAGGWRFRPGEKTREADGLALAIDDVLDRVEARRLSWTDLEEYAGGAAAVPERVSYDEELAAGQIPLARALLDEIDGVRTLAELATRCGLTTYEAGYVLAQLVESGAVQLVGQAAPIAPVATAPVPPPRVDEPLAEVDLAMQLAVLARQAEEARWTAEARRRERITARRAARDAPAAVDEPAAPLGLAPIGLAPQDERTASPFEDLLGPTPDPAETPWSEPIGLEPIGLAPLEPYGSATSDLPIFELPLPEQPGLAELAFEEPFAAASAVTDAAEVTEVADEVLPTREVSPAAETQAMPADEAMANLASLADLVGAIDLAALDGGPPQPSDAPDAPDAYPTAHTAANTAAHTGVQPPHAPADPQPADGQAATWAGGSSAPAKNATGPLPSYAPVWDADPVTGFSPDLEDAHAQADTAALLRELSFLGVDDAPPPAPTPRPAPPRPVPASFGGSAKPKRKSIFGR